jgi:hypothetical protein
MTPAEGAAAILRAVGEIQIEYLSPAQRQEWRALVSVGLWSALAHEPAVQKWLTLRSLQLERQ